MSVSNIFWVRIVYTYETFEGDCIQCVTWHRSSASHPNPQHASPQTTGVGSIFRRVTAAEKNS
jgi:hypothetical protein